ncbi:MAG: YicC/YloC family endoribonuclease [Bacteroidia bacterium]
MIQSMTGYGAATKASGNYQVTVELKSLNSKFLELSLKLPRVYMKYEQRLRNILSQQLVRGKIAVLINVEVLSADKRTLQINKVLAKKYLTEIRSLGQYLEMESDVDLKFILELPDVIPTEIEKEDSEEWGLIQTAMDEACQQMIATRNEEGLALDKDLSECCDAIDAALEGIKILAPKRMETIRARIDQSLEDIRHKVETDQNRFEQELIFYLEKLDINEEIVRLGQHIKFFRDLQIENKSNGKQLQFLSQEMGREINTIGSKANDAEIQRLVVGMKNDLEKIKEQVLNIV